MGRQLIKIASVYFAVGVLLSLIMSVSGDYRLSNVQSHINFLGWASLGLIGLTYVAFSAASTTLLASIHFWLHNIGLPVLILGIAARKYGVHDMEPVIIIGGLLLVVAVVLFMVNLWKHLR